MLPKAFTRTSIKNSLGEKLDMCLHEGTREDVLLVFGHGVTGNKDRPLLMALAEGLSEQGWPCLRFSFAGNGGSEGKFEDATISKEVGDLKAVLDAVPAGVRVVYAGHSMGAAVGVKIAVDDDRIAGLISLAGMVYAKAFVEREFGDLVPDQDVMWEDGDCPLSKAYVDDLNQIDSLIPQAAKIQQPWLLIHGSADDVIPIKDSQDALDAATCQKEWLEVVGAEHVFDDASYPRLIDGIAAWLERYFGLVL